MGTIMKTITYKNIKLTPETEVKLIKFDERPDNKKTIKIKDINSKMIQDITDLYKDLYLFVNGRNIQVSPSDAGRILIKLSNSDTSTKNYLNKFIDFEESVDNNMKTKSHKLNNFN